VVERISSYLPCLPYLPTSSGYLWQDHSGHQIKLPSDELLATTTRISLKTCSLYKSVKPHQVETPKSGRFNPTFSSKQPPFSTRPLFAHLPSAESSTSHSILPIFLSQLPPLQSESPLKSANPGNSTILSHPEGLKQRSLQFAVLRQVNVSPRFLPRLLITDKCI
jgi:hypothetical protein